MKHEAALRELNTFRNLLAHSAYSVSADEVHALSFLVSYRKPKSTPLNMHLTNMHLTNMHRSKYKRVLEAFQGAVVPSTEQDMNAYIRTA
jgi:hypothetical protein